MRHSEADLKSIVLAILRDAEDPLGHSEISERIYGEQETEAEGCDLESALIVLTLDRQITDGADGYTLTPQTFRVRAWRARLRFRGWLHNLANRVMLRLPPRWLVGLSLYRKMELEEIWRLTEERDHILTGRPPRARQCIPITQRNLDTFTGDMQRVQAAMDGFQRMLAELAEKIGSMEPIG